jgi:hypothetical protein
MRLLRLWTALQSAGLTKQVAVIAAEPGYIALEKCIEANTMRFCSAVSVWETGR